MHPSFPSFSADQGSVQSDSYVNALKRQHGAMSAASEGTVIYMLSQLSGQVNNMQGQLTILQDQVAEIRARSNNDSARRKNGCVGTPDAALASLGVENMGAQALNAVPPNFPPNMAAARGLSHQQLNALSAFYNIPYETGGLLPARVNAFCLFIGLQY